MALARTVLKHFSGKVGAAGLTFLALTYFAREFGAAVMGVFFVVEAFVGLVGLVSDAGIKEGVAKRLSEGGDHRRTLGTAVLLKAATLVATALVLYSLRGPITAYVGEPILELLVVLLVTREAATFTLAVLKGEHSVGSIGSLELVRAATFLASGVALSVLVGETAEVVVFAFCLSFGAQFLYGATLVRTRPGRSSLDKGRSLFTYSRYAFVSNVGGYVYSWMDVVVLGLFVASGPIGTYEMAWRVTMVVMLFSSSVATAIFPKISRWDADDSVAAIERLVPKMVTTTLAVAVPAFVGTTVLAGDVLGYVFGPEFRAASLVLVVLMGEKVLQSAHLVLGRSLQAIDRPKYAAIASVASIVANLVLNFALIWKLGILGAALATSVSFTLNTALHAYYLRRFLTFSFERRNLGWIALSSLLMGAVVWAGHRWLTPDGLLDVLVLVGLGALSYAGFLLLSSDLRRRVRDSIAYSS